MKKKILLIILMVIILGVGLYAFFNLNDKTTKTEVKKLEDILVTQYNLEQEYLEELKNGNYTINNPKVILDPYGISPLTALIIFETEEAKEVEVTIVGKDDKTTINHIFEAGKEHILPIYGLYADYDNMVVIVVEDEEVELNIKTDPLPEDFTLPTNVVVNKDKVSSDLIFVSIATRGYNAAYDVNGDPRWFLIGNFAWDIGRLENGRLMLGSPRPIAPPYHTVGLMEMDLTGKIYKEYVMPGGYHHDYFEMEDGNLLVASNSFPLGTVEDYIVLIDRDTGNILKEWDLNEVLPQEDGKSAMWVEYDWFHNNSVWYDKDNNAIILSGRHQDAVISIDYESGDLNWIIGDSTNWSEEMQEYFFKPVGDAFEWQWAQHAAMVLPNGDIFILDNGNNRSKIESEFVKAEDNYTRGVIYRINTEDMTIKQIWQYGKERGSDFYSPYISDVDYYGVGHYLVHSGGIGKVDGKALNVPAPMNPDAKMTSITTEILNDEVIFELELPSNYYRAEKMSLYASNNFEFGKGKRLGSLGVTPTIDEDNKLSSASLDIPELFEVEFKKEVDRLIFSAKLKEGTRVRIILDGGRNNIKTYALTVSSRAYTAMCLDIFNEHINEEDADEININSYINNEGLKGKYNIYLKIDEEIYNTNQFVKF